MIAKLETTRDNKVSLLKHLRTILNSSHDGRITQSTLDFWRSEEPLSDNVIISIVRINDIKPVSVSACRIGSDRSVSKTITVTKSAYRQRGFGLKALLAKIENLKEQNINYKTTVADSNQPSKALMSAAGLHFINSRDSRRGDGESYLQLIYSIDLVDTQEVNSGLTFNQIVELGNDV